MQGENGGIMDTGAEIAGLSPHAGGERSESIPQQAGLRTIPPCRGRTWSGAQQARRCTDHPPMQGENSDCDSISCACGGPSPHAGGERSRLVWIVGHARTIPPCRGRTVRSLPSKHSNADHPPMQGENFAVHGDNMIHTGPSPHAGGEPEWNRHLQLRHRTIPPCRGRTIYRWSCRGLPSDHPPMQGENLGPIRFKSPPSGPSPHAGGEHEHGDARSIRRRTIPPCRGRTRKADRRAAAVADHPPMQGENVRPLPESVPMFGPSPHAGGERRYSAAAFDVFRTIPPCRGRTSSSPPTRTPSPDHPPMQGENRNLNAE